jgi:MSHA biogenesis protein MshO
MRTSPSPAIASATPPMPCHDEMLAAMTALQRGFTLLEAIIVITITGIIAAVVAVFIRAPVQGYFDSARRAELTDIADTAVRRISRDLHLALPNSVRLANPQVMEFLQTRTGGRYRAEGPGDFLDFNAPDTTFDVLGPPVTMAANDQIVIYNLGVPGADAYEGNSSATQNRRPYGGGAGPTSNVLITSVNPLPFDSPSHRFQVVDTPVTYLCDPTPPGTGTLRRYSGYAITAAQPNPPAGAGVLLAQNVSNCIFTYAPGVTARNGLVSIRLEITQSGETVSLYHEVHVSNVP